MSCARDRRIRMKRLNSGSCSFSWSAKQSAIAMVSIKTERHGNTEKGHQLRSEGVREGFLEGMTFDLILKEE